MVAVKINMTIPMLSIIPVARIVPRVPEATPNDFFSIEDITAFVLGEEKSANPKPSRQEQPR